MQKKFSLVVASVVLLSLSGCGIFSEKPDETANWSVTKLYSEAASEMEGKRYDAAIKLYEKLESSYPFGTYAQQAQMEIAYAYYKSGDQAQALAAVERFIKLHPNHANVDYMYYLRGLVNFNDQIGFLNFIYTQDPTERDPKATRDAFAAFKDLAERFPNSKYTPDALARMKYLVNAMASYEIHVARYYYRREAFLAAANRAQGAVQDYRNSPSTEEGLYIMMRAYDKLGQVKLRDDTERVFLKNFPDSRFLDVKGNQPERHWWKFWQSAPQPSI
jgi:outer membrane protein assembly factor BamD